MILLKGSPAQSCGDAAVALRRPLGRRRHRESRLSTAVGARFEARHIAGDELRPDRDGRSLSSSCTPLAYPRYTRSGAVPAIVLTLLARPFPANRRAPAESCTSTQESAEKLRRKRARPAPGAIGVRRAAAAACGVAAVTRRAGGRARWPASRCRGRAGRLVAARRRRRRARRMSAARAALVCALDRVSAGDRPPSAGRRGAAGGTARSLVPRRATKKRRRRATRPPRRRAMLRPWPAGGFLSASASARSTGCKRGRRRRGRLGVVSGATSAAGNPSMLAYLLQMPLGVHRRTDALIIARSRARR